MSKEEAIATCKNYIKHIETGMSGGGLTEAIKVLLAACEKPEPRMSKDTLDSVLRKCFYRPPFLPKTLSDNEKLEIMKQIHKSLDGSIEMFMECGIVALSENKKEAI